MLFLKKLPFLISLTFFCSSGFGEALKNEYSYEYFEKNRNLVTNFMPHLQLESINKNALNEFQDATTGYILYLNNSKACEPILNKLNSYKIIKFSANPEKDLSKIKHFDQRYSLLLSKIPYLDESLNPILTLNENEPLNEVTINYKWWGNVYYQANNSYSGYILTTPVFAHSLKPYKVKPLLFHYRDKTRYEGGSFDSDQGSFSLIEKIIAKRNMAHYYSFLFRLRTAYPEPENYLISYRKSEYMEAENNWENDENVDEPKFNLTPIQNYKVSIYRNNKDEYLFVVFNEIAYLQNIKEFSSALTPGSGDEVQTNINQSLICLFTNI